MTAQFDFTALRTTAIGLVNQFGRHVPCVVLRPVEAAPANPALPWRLSAPASIRQFPFIGVVSTLGFPKRADPVTDRDLDVLAGGDLVDVVDLGDATTSCGIPTTADRIQVTTLGVVYQYQIIGVQDVTPDDKAIIIKMRCKLWPQIIGQPPTGF